MRIAITILCCVLSSVLIAQESEKYIAEGNKHYKKGEFTESRENYEKALESDPSNFRARYNQANSLYRNEKYDEAADEFAALGELAENDMDKARSFHNLGNAYLQQKKYKESIEAYKNALRANPNDEESRYNLAYAKRMQKKEQNKDQNQDKQQKDQQQQQNQDQDQQQNQDKNDEQEQKDKQDQEKDQNQDKKDDGQDQQQKSQPKPNKLTKEQAERMLNAIGKKEKRNMDDQDKKKGKAIKVESEKKW